MTKYCSQLGIVSAGTKAFDRNTNGNITTTPIADAVEIVFVHRLMNANTQLRHQATSIMKSMLKMTAGMPASGL
ncbi:MAG: hypothetical protein NHB15_09990 [Methanosarcina barkeri]|nr:hypothetical protein [Methanosarcina sp. ERenArc_MAG2]